MRNFGHSTGFAARQGFLNAANRGGTGDNGKPSLTVDEAAAQITRDGYSWNGFDVIGKATSVTYAFRGAAPGTMPEDTGGFSRFTAAQINATVLALQAWSDVANITFTRVGSGTTGNEAYSNNASMLFGNYSSGVEGAAAFAFYPYSRSSSSSDGDLWVNSTLSYNVSPQLLNYGQLVLIHEIGHAIGLSHPGDYDASEDEDITYSAHAEYYEDSMQYSVMSYFIESHTGADFGPAYPATVMLDDIAAAQRLYGANMATRTGDTTYGFNSTADRPWFSAASSASILVFAVWDAGGTDTFDFSGYGAAQIIDLNQGAFSNVGGLAGNVAVAMGVVIENAIGGSGADTLYGNSAANVLRGGAGADVLKGAGGNDTLTGGAAADIFVFTAAGGADVVTDFVVGADKLDATAFGSYLSIAQSGADTLVTFASGVTARLTGVTASTVTNASFIGLVSTPPSINGSAGADTLTGGAGADIINGLGGNDTLRGLGGADVLDGGAGNDSLDGGTGADVMRGGAGDDAYTVDDAGDTTVELAGGGTDTVSTARAAWTLAAEVENLTGLATTAQALTGNVLANRITGAAGADTLNGLGGADTLRGMAGNDTLNGGEGADSLDGGAGADILRGEAGDDSYVVDNIADRTIELAGQGIDTVATALRAWALTAEVENLTGLAATGQTLTGNALANRITGGGGADTLSGGLGADTLIGGAGADVMTGGSGNDIFVFNLTTDSTVAARDRITDFNQAQDRLNLSAIDANTRIAGDQAFVFVGAFTHAAGQAVRSYSSGQTRLDFDVNGDGVADMSILLTGNVTGGWIL